MPISRLLCYLNGRTYDRRFGGEGEVGEALEPKRALEFVGCRRGRRQGDGRLQGFPNGQDEAAGASCADPYVQLRHFQEAGPSKCEQYAHAFERSRGNPETRIRKIAKANEVNPRAVKLL